MMVKSKVVKPKPQPSGGLGGIAIPYDHADAVTVANLRDLRGALSDELKAWKKNPRTDSNFTGVWLHEEDVIGHAKLVEAMGVVLNYLGDK